MSKIYLSVLISIIFFTSIYAQKKFSDVGVYDEKYEVNFFPYKKGEMKIFINDILGKPGYNKNEEKIFSNKLNQVIDIICLSRTFSPPQGSVVHLARDNKYNTLFKKQPPRLYADINVRLLAFIEGGVSGKEIVHEDESGTDVNLSFNNPNAVLSAVPVVDDIYTLPGKVDKFHGFDIYDSERTLISFIDRPIFIPVSQEDYLQTVIDIYEKDYNNAKTIQQSDEAKQSGRDEFDQGEEQRRKDLQKAYEELKKYDPAAAEEMKKNLESNLAAATNNIHEDAYLNTSKATLLAPGIKHTTDVINKFKKALNALTPQQRKAQAYWHQNGFDLSPTGLVPGNTEGAIPMIRINKNYLDPNKPQSALQVLVIGWSLSESNDAQPRNFSGGKPGRQTKDIELVNFSRESNIWDKIINLIGKQ